VRLPDGTTALRVVRPAFRRLLDDIENGAVGAVIAYDLDRVARDPRDLEDLIDAVESSHIPTKSVTGSLDLSTDAGVTMARVMVAVANKSSRDTARRVARKHLDLAHAGKDGGGGIRPFGYNPDRVTINKAEAKVLRAIAARIIKGESLTSIAKWLTRSRVTPVRGGAAWNARSVHAVVTKPRVAGLREHRGEIIGPATWPAILSRDTWERVNICLGDRAQGNTNTLRYWLNNVLRCALCNHGLIASAGNKGRRRYWCSTVRGGCGRITLDLAKAEDTLERMLLTYVRRPDVLADLRASASTSNLDRLREEVRLDEGQLNELAVLWSNRAVTTAEYLAARKSIEERIATAGAILRSSLPGVVRQIVSGDVEATWKAFSAAQRREVAEIVWPSGVRVDPSIPGAARIFRPERLVPVDWEAASVTASA
jgi:DNA invertase Pin-like site-specific DNA recombinase